MSVISCWCEESVPPWSVVWIKSILNPSANEEPIVIVTRPRASNDPDYSKTLAVNEKDLNLYTPDGSYVFYDVIPGAPQYAYLSNIRNCVLTNGLVAVPAKTVFQCSPLSLGLHWLRYDEAVASPTDEWYYPRDDTWHLGSNGDATWTTSGFKSAAGQSRSLLEHRVHGVVFRRLGLADTIQKCVPVVMAMVNFQVDDFLSVA